MFDDVEFVPEFGAELETVTDTSLELAEVESFDVSVILVLLVVYVWLLVTESVVLALVVLEFVSLYLLPLVTFPPFRNVVCVTLEDVVARVVVLLVFSSSLLVTRP